LTPFNISFTNDFLPSTLPAALAGLVALTVGLVALAAGLTALAVGLAAGLAT
jgi:hypothetical protein